jgi:hypothetical protein
MERRHLFAQFFDLMVMFFLHYHKLKISGAKGVQIAQRCSVTVNPAMNERQHDMEVSRSGYSLVSLEHLAQQR